MVMLYILIAVCYAIVVRMVWVIHDKIDFLENNLKEIDKSQIGIRESIDKIETVLSQIDYTLDDIEDDINELKKYI